MLYTFNPSGQSGRKHFLKIYSPASAELNKASGKLKEGGSDKVLPEISHAALTRKVKKWLGRIGHDVWPALFNNFRRSAVTDKHYDPDIPSHVVDVWFGHCESVSKAAYRQAVDEYSNRVKGKPSTLTDLKVEETSLTSDGLIS